MCLCFALFSADPELVMMAFLILALSSHLAQLTPLIGYRERGRWEFQQWNEGSKPLSDFFKAYNCFHSLLCICYVPSPVIWQ